MDSVDSYGHLCTSSNGIPFSFSFYKVRQMAKNGDTDVVI